MSKLSYTALEKSFTQLSLRERVIMFVALIICSASIAYFTLLDPALLAQEKLVKRIQESSNKEKQLINQIAEINEQLKLDPLEEINHKIAFTEATLVQLDEQLDAKLVKFIHAQKMPVALTKVMAKTPGVKISSLKSLPVKAFNPEQKAEASELPTIFYQHTLEITLQGNYNAIYQYLLNLENLSEKFYWRSLSYQVADYPLAEVSIQIYTLSGQQDIVSG